MAISWGDYNSGSTPFDWPDNTKISLDPVLYKLFITDETVLKLFKQKETVTNVEHKWTEYVGPVPTVTATFTASTNTLTISAPSNTDELLVRVRKYAQLEAPDGSFVVEFTSDPVVGANTVQVVAGSGSDVTSDSTWTVVALPAADEERIEQGKLLTKTMRKNFTQIFSRGLEIAKTRMSTVTYPDETGLQEFNRQLKDKLLEIKREMDIAAVKGVPRTSGGTPTGDNQYHTWAGLRYFLRDPDLDGTNEDTLVVDAGGATITPDIINTAVRNIWNAGGLGSGSDMVLVCSVGTKRTINGFDEAMRRTDREDKTAGYVVDTFLTDLGVEIPIMVDRYVRDDEVFILDKSKLVLNWMKGDKIAITKLPQTNPRVMEYHISGQATLEIIQPEIAHALIRNLG